MTTPNTRKTSPATSWQSLKARTMSAESRARVDARVQETLASLPLSDLRRALGITQVELADSLEVGQGSISKLEHQQDMYLSTLRRYVEALGGTLHLTAEFPEGRRIEIEGIADVTG